MREKWPRKILGRSSLHGQFFVVGFLCTLLDGLSERGTTRSLLEALLDTCKKELILVHYKKEKILGSKQLLLKHHISAQNEGKQVLATSIGLITVFDAILTDKKKIAQRLLAKLHLLTLRFINCVKFNFGKSYLPSDSHTNSNF